MTARKGGHDSDHFHVANIQSVAMQVFPRNRANDQGRQLGEIERVAFGAVHQPLFCADTSEETELANCFSSRGGTVKSIEPSIRVPFEADKTDEPVSVSISAPRWELIQLCVHVTRLLGVPRSVCEIFGFVFTSSIPVTFEDIVAGLGMSNGSASHGLRYLRRVGALSVTYLARDRRDYYVAEVSLGRLVSGYLLENVTHHLADNRERISAMRAALEAENGSDHLTARVELLFEWNRQVCAAISLASEALVARSPEAK